MKRKRYCLLVVSMLFAGSLCMGCAQAPDEVRKDMEKYGDNQQAEELETKTCTIEELRNSGVKNITQEYENIVLPEQIDFSGIQEVSLLKFQIVKNYSEQKEKYARAFGLSGELDWKRDEETKEGGMIYDSKEKREYLSVGDNGHVHFEQKESYTELSDGTEDDEEEEAAEEEEKKSDIEERIYLKRGDSAEKNVNLNGQEVALSEEIDWLNQEINQIASTDNAFEYDVRTVYVRKRENGFQHLSISAQMEYKGVTLDFFGAGLKVDDEKGLACVKQMENSIHVEMDAHKEIASMGNVGFFEVVEEKPLEQVIDFQSAVDIVERKMAGFRKLSIAEVQVMYTLIPKYDYTELGAEYAAPGNIVETRPVYCFMVKHGEEDSGSLVLEGNELCYINVDMVTGEVTDNLEEGDYSFQ